MWNGCGTTVFFTSRNVIVLDLLDDFNLSCVGDLRTSVRWRYLINTKWKATKMRKIFCLFSIKFLHLSQVRAVDEMNYDFQALALESRGMGEVSSFGPDIVIFFILYSNEFRRNFVWNTSLSTFKRCLKTSLIIFMYIGLSEGRAVVTNDTAGERHKPTPSCLQAYQGCFMIRAVNQ